MSEEFIPLAIPNITEAEGANLQKCIETTFVSTVGEFVVEFEERVAKLSGTYFEPDNNLGSCGGIAMGAGTMALHMALHGSNIGQGDLVICPSFTFIASANSIRHANARPWLFDVSPDSWTIDTQQVAEALKTKTQRDADGVLRHTESGDRVAAIMPVYTLGTPADMEEIIALSEDYGLPIIADAAAAIGVDYKGKPIGDMADFTCYSFNGNKTITSGGGGMVVGRNREIMNRIKHVSTTARVWPNYDHDEVGYNYRMTNIEAAVGCAQLDRLEDFVAAKQKIRRRYDAEFADVAGISAFPYPDDRGSTCWFSGFVVEDENLPQPEEICAKLGEQRIQARIFWKPVHMQVPYADTPMENCAYSEDVYKRIVTLPCSTQLTEVQQARVIRAVREILGA